MIFKLSWGTCPQTPLLPDGRQVTSRETFCRLPLYPNFTLCNLANDGAKTSVTAHSRVCGTVFWIALFKHMISNYSFITYFFSLKNHPFLHCTTLHYTTLHYTTLHYTTLHYTALHYTTLHYTTLHYTTLHYTTLHYTTLHYTTLHYTTLHYTTLHYTTLHYTTPHHTTPHHTTPHHTTPHHTTPHHTTLGLTPHYARPYTHRPEITLHSHFTQVEMSRPHVVGQRWQCVR